MEVVDSGAATAGGDELTGGGGGTPEWLGTLPEELRGDETLGRYKSVEDLARGHIEARKVASSRLVIPGNEAGDEDWGKVWTALGVPEKAEAYGDFGLDPLADDSGDDAKTAREAMVKGYQEQLHALKVPPRLASAIVKADIARINAAQESYYAKGEEEIGALKKELGANYEPQKTAAKAMFLKIFGEEAAPLADELDQKVGSGRLMRGMMTLAKVAGEHIRVDGGNGGDFAATAEAQKQLDARMADKSWRDRYKAGEAVVVAEYNKLLSAATAQAAATS